MELTAQTINTILLILPGLLGLRFYSVLTGVQPDTMWRHAIDALIFSLLIYIPLQSIGFWEPLVRIQPSTLNVDIARPAVIASVLGAALCLAGIYSLAAHAGWVSSVLRWLRLTTLTANETAWHDVLSKRKYLKVLCEDGETIFGWPRYYSLSADYGFIYLQNCYVLKSDEDEWLEVDDAEGILLDYAKVCSIEVSNVELKRG